MYGWCPMHVGCDASSLSLGWSLPPSIVLIVLALVNSVVLHRGTWVSQRDLGVPPHSLTVPLPQDCCAFWFVPMSIVVEVTSKWTMWLPLCMFPIRCVTYVNNGTIPVVSSFHSFWTLNFNRGSSAKELITVVTNKPCP